MELLLLQIILHLEILLPLNSSNPPSRFQRTLCRLIATRDSKLLYILGHLNCSISLQTISLAKYVSSAINHTI